MGYLFAGLLIFAAIHGSWRKYKNKRGANIPLPFWERPLFRRDKVEHDSDSPTTPKRPDVD
jgi:hypothetical protein